jgi:hypothetical protein
VPNAALFRGMTDRNHQPVCRLATRECRADLQRRIAMIDRSDLTRKANDLRQQAELEANEQTRNTLLRLADHYAHLAESQAESEANPVDATSLGELFTKGE